MIQDLARYERPSSDELGASFFLRFIWFCFGSPLLALRSLPGSFWRVALLRFFGAHIGCACRIKPGLRVKYPWRLTIGNCCWLGEDVWIDNLALVTLGDRVCISQSSYLCTGNHDYRSPSFELHISPITIGSDSWIAAHAVLAPGAQISPGAVVALGAVVSGIVNERCIVRGNPAVVVGQR